MLSFFYLIFIIFPSIKLHHTNVPSLRSRTLFHWRTKSVDKIIQQRFQMTDKFRYAARCNGANMRRPKYSEGKRLCPPQIPHLGETCGLQLLWRRWQKFIPKCLCLPTDLHCVTSRSLNIHDDAHLNYHVWLKKFNCSVAEFLQHSTTFGCSIPLRISKQ
jgi:hypothetical protein